MQTYDFSLTGYVGSCDFDKDYVEFRLNKSQGKPVAVRIDSLGGSLATALSITSAFARHGEVSVHFTGMNASAATISSLGAAHISIDSSAMYLVHQCSLEFFQWASMNADQLQQQIDELEQMRTDLAKMDKHVAEMYAKRCKRTTEDLLALMQKGGWLTAKEALEWGFVDEIIDYKEDKAPVLTKDIATAMVAAGMPLPNMPIAQAEPAMARFFAAIASLFDKQPKHNTAMQQFPLLGNTLARESFEVVDGNITLTQADAQTIEQHLATVSQQLTAAQADVAAKDKQIAELNKRLEKEPAASTTQVITGAGAHQQTFADVCNNAAALLAELPD